MYSWEPIGITRAYYLNSHMGSSSMPMCPIVSDRCLILLCTTHCTWCSQQWAPPFPLLKSLLLSITFNVSIFHLCYMAPIAKDNGLFSYSSTCCRVPAMVARLAHYYYSTDSKNLVMHHFVKKKWVPANTAEVQHSHWLCILSMLHISAALATSKNYVAAQWGPTCRVVECA
jgi:hypothetical protein